MLPNRIQIIVFWFLHRCKYFTIFVNKIEIGIYCDQSGLFQEHIYHRPYCSWIQEIIRTQLAD